MSCFVLVHGSWGGGWIWSRVTPLLRAAGHDVLAPTLTGLGDRRHLLSAETSLTTHIDDVANLLEFERLEDVVLVGHSYGGAVTAGALGRQPGRVGHMVYLDAYTPVPGQACLDILPAFREPLDAVAAQHGGLYLDPLDPAGFGVTDPAESQWIDERSTLMPYAPIKDPLPAPTAPAAELVKPTTYVSCVGLGLFLETADAARAAGWTVHDLDTHHFLQVSQPEAVAEILLQAAA